MSDGRGLSARGIWGLSILVAAVLLLAGLAALPFAWQTYAAAGLDEKRLELRFIEAKLKAADRVARNRLTSADDIGGIFVAGTTPGLALAELQNFIGKLALDNGMAVERLQPLQTEHKGGLAVLRMEVETAGSIESLRGYLLAIETGLPLVFVNRAKITAQENRGEDNSTLPSDNLTVALQLEAYGWWEANP